jgi:hypothetical protein
MAEGSKDLDEEARLRIVVDVWKYVVSVQMHFNDMEMRIRNLYFTILAASLGLLGVVEGKRVEVNLLNLRISVALLVIAALIPVSMLFYFMDRHWYHRLLLGAVVQGNKIEQMYGDKLPEIQLGSEISKASPVKFTGIWKLLFFFIKDPRFRSESRLHSDHKIEILYKSVIWGAVLVIVAYGLVGGIEVKGSALLSSLFSEIR